VGTRDLKAVLEIAIKSIGEDRLKKLVVSLDKVSGQVRKLDAVFQKTAPAGAAGLTKTSVAAQKLAAQLGVADARMRKYNADANKADVGARKIAHAIAAAGAAGAMQAAKAAAQQRLLNAQLDLTVAKTNKVRSAQQLQAAAAQRRSARQPGTFGQSVSNAYGTAGKAAALMVGGYYAGRAVADVMGGLFRPAIDFESQMAQVQIKGQFNPADQAKLSQAAMHMGRTSMFNPIEAASEQVNLAASGLTAEQILQVMPIAKKFAIGAGMTGNEASDALVSTANQFGMPLNTDSFNRIGNALTIAANASVVDVKDLLETLKFSGPIANLSGAGIEELSASIATIGQSGLKGSMAGTGSRNMYAAMANLKGGKRTDKYLKRLGWSRKEVAGYLDAGDGQMAVPKFLAELSRREEAAGFKKSERIGFMQSAMGQYGMTAAEILRKGGETGDLGKMLAKVRDPKNVNAMETAYQTRLATPQAQLDTVSARWETLLITFGTQFMPEVLRFLGLTVQRLEELIQIVDIMGEKPSQEQITRGQEAGGIAAYGPGIAPGATAGSVAGKGPGTWGAFLDALGKGGGGDAGAISGSGMGLEITVKAENGTTAKITKVDKGKTPLRANVTAAP